MENKEFKKGDTVKFEIPMDEGEKISLFEIIDETEDITDRVLIRDITPTKTKMFLRPTTIYKTADLILVERK
jgi:hypothetical protein